MMTEGIHEITVTVTVTGAPGSISYTLSEMKSHVMNGNGMNGCARSCFHRVPSIRVTGIIIAIWISEMFFLRTSMSLPMYLKTVHRFLFLGAWALLE